VDVTNRAAACGRALLFLLLALAVGCADESGDSGGAEIQYIYGGGGAPGMTGLGGTGGNALGSGGNNAITGDDNPAVGDSSWCQALGVLRTSCQGCHGAQLAYGAPMPLVTHGDTQAASPSDGSPVHQGIGARIHDAVSPMPPTSQPQLTPEQKALIDTWIAEGAPAGADPACTGLAEAPPEPTEEEFVWPEDCEERYEFRANSGGGPHIVRANTETHPQFDFNVPWSGEVQAIAIRPITDNKRVLHHWILYEGSAFLTGWSPGKGGDLPPDNVGVYMPSSGTLTLDVHYYNIGNDQDEPDNSGVEVCVTHNLRDNTAATFPFMAPADANGGGRTVSDDTCTVDAPDGPVYLMASSPHMHKLGVHAKLEVLRQDGSVEVLHDLPFSFEDQVTNPLSPSIELRDGDRVRTTCVYENPSPNSVSFGTGSDDEMCFNFARFYPMCGLSCRPTGTTESLIQASQGAGCPSEGSGGFPGF